MGVDNILRRCVLEHERPMILAEDHEGITEKIMQEKIPLIRYCMQDYGGRPFIEMQRNTARNVIYVRGLENLIDGMRCP
jgi:hypothetical protein